VKSNVFISLNEKRYFKNSILNFLYIFLSYFRLTKRVWGMKCPKCNSFVPSSSFKCSTCGYNYIITFKQTKNVDKSIYEDSEEIK
jgi:DNA-directed RNA polymerase subunit RPC12/RpoP